MKREELYDAITSLRDDQILEGEKKPARGARRRWIRVGALAAVLAVALLAGLVLVPKLATGKTEPSQAGSLGGDKPEPSGASSQAPLLLNCALVRAEYPQMAPYPNEMDYFSGTGMDFDAYETAYEAWMESRSALRPDTDYTKNLGSYLKKVLPVLLEEETPGGNRVCAPLNVYMALAMLSETCQGQARMELLELLGVPDLDTLRQRAKALWQANYCDDGLVTSLLADSIWLREGTEYYQPTLDRLAADYYASAFSGAMGSEEYNEALRAWMNEQTKGLLSDQIQGIETFPDTVMALISTVYYKAAWTGPFYKQEEDVFRGTAGDEPCSMLLETTEQLYYRGQGFSAVGKSLSGSGSLYLLLPEEGSSPEALLARESTLDFLTDPVARNHTDSKMANVHLRVPEFDLSAQVDLIPGLRALGVETVFSPAADFSPLTTDTENPISVTEAKHGARLMIDKDGATGAAYTEIMATEGAIEEPKELEEIDFFCDRPFLFVLTNAEGMPFFVGIVNTVCD